MRILHYSDPHIPTPLHKVPLLKWIGKRSIGGTNLILGRSRLFKKASTKLEALNKFKQEEKVELVLCTGDYTALGLNHEYTKAANVIRPLMNSPLGYVHVPGNHDYYASDALRDDRFQSHFGETLESNMPEYQVDGPWPLVRLIDENVCVIAVNSSKPNPIPWHSNGKISEKQLSALQAIAKDPRLVNRLIIVITHFAPLLANGNHDTRRHGLINADAFLTTLSFFPRSIVLCGHVHKCFHVIDSKTDQAIFCAGSATMEGKEGFWLFDLDGDNITATQGRWNIDKFVLNFKNQVTFTTKKD